MTIYKSYYHDKFIKFKNFRSPRHSNIKAVPQFLPIVCLFSPKSPTTSCRHVFILINCFAAAGRRISLAGYVSVVAADFISLVP